MKSAVFFRIALFLPVLFYSFSSDAQAKGCMAGGCHQKLTNVKYMHGPVAAEMAGVKACEICHVPVRSKCSSKKAGKFKLKSKGLCLTCHVKGTGSQHSSGAIAAKCLKCHSPHGSDSSSQMLRPGITSKKKKS